MTVAPLQGSILDAQLSANRKLPAYGSLKSSSIPFVPRLPSHWRVEKLKYLASVRFSTVDKKSEEKELPVRLCNYTDVYNRDVIVDDPGFMQATATQAEVDKFTLRKGDVLITKDSEEWNDIAVPAHVAQDLPGVLCGYHLALIRPNQNELYSSFLSRAFSARGIREQFHIAANGITRFGLPNRAISGALFPVPSLAEQRAIATFLDRETAKIDELIQHKNRLCDLLDERLHSLICRVTTQGLRSAIGTRPSRYPWLPYVPNHWRLVALSWVGRISNGSTPSQGNPDYWQDGDVPWVSSAEVNQHRIIHPTAFITRLALSECSLCIVPKGAVLIGMIGQGRTRGMTSILGIDACINQNVAAIEPSAALDAEFLQFALIQAYEPIRQFGRGGQQEALNCRLVGGIRIALPPLHEQREIALHLRTHRDNVLALKQRLREHNAKLNEYRSALITAAATGQIDVRNYCEDPPCP
jgi:type I restriction enzyme S subunit